MNTGADDIPERKAFLENQALRARQAPQQRIPLPLRRPQAMGTGVRG